MSDRTSNHCCECGMTVDATEYHPYAACLMFRACHDSRVVQDNLDAVVVYGMAKNQRSDETFDGLEGRNGTLNACCYRHLCKAEGKLFARLRDLLEDLNIPALLKVINEREQKGEPRLPCLVSVSWVQRAAKALGYGTSSDPRDGEHQ